MRGSFHLVLSLLLSSSLLGVQFANGQAVPHLCSPALLSNELCRQDNHILTTSASNRINFCILVVDQRGIDVVVRAFSPAGSQLREFDSPNGTSGPEDVTLIAATSGVYRIEVGAVKWL